MTETMQTGLEVLIFLAISVLTLCSIALIRYIAGVGTNNRSGEPVKVLVEAESKDNSYTMYAAEAAAKGQVESAKINAKAAADTRAAEEARLERTRLELQADTSSTP